MTRRFKSPTSTAPTPLPEALLPICDAFWRIDRKRHLARSISLASRAGAVAAVVVAAIFAVQRHRLSSTLIFECAFFSGILIAAVLIGAAIARNFFTLISLSEAAERLDSAFQTHNAVASALNLSLEDRGSFHIAAVAEGRRCLSALHEHEHLAATLAKFYPPMAGRWLRPLAVFSLGIFLSLLITQIRFRDVAAVAGMKDGSAQLEASTSGSMGASTETPHVSAKADRATLASLDAGTQAMKANLRDPSAASGATGGNTARDIATASANSGTASGSNASPANASGAKQSNASSPLASPSGSSSPVRKDGSKPGVAESSNPLDSSPDSAQANKPGAGASPAGSQESGSAESSGSTPPKDGAPAPSGTSGQPDKSKSAPKSAGGTPPPPSDSSQEKAASSSASNNDASSAQNSGKPSNTSGEMKKSRGVPPLLLGHRQQDTMAGTLMPGPEERSMSLSPPQPREGFASATVNVTPVNSSSAPVDSFHVDASNVSAVADYLLTLHRDEADAPTESGRAPQP